VQAVKWTAIVVNAHYHLPIADEKKLWVSGTNNTYSINIFCATPEVTHFTHSCLNAYGAAPTCKDLETGLNAQPLVNYVELSCGIYGPIADLPNPDPTALYDYG
jgi:hypothetical protein